MRTPRRHGGHRALVALIVVAGAASASGVVWRASNAAFVGSTTNGPDTFSSGTVTISDNDNGSTVFSASGLTPGATGVGCIRVSYTGTLASAVRLYSASETATNALDAYLSFQVETGTFTSVPGFPGCTTFAPTATIVNGTLASFAAATTFAAGAGTWSPSGANQTQDYRISYALSTAAPTSTQASNASVTLVWEAQSA